MKFVADFHIHSHYSRATSKDMNIISLTKWGQLKGINVIGTGDFTHPRWLKELEDTLEPAEPGLYKLKPEYESSISAQVPNSCRSQMRFVLTVEISTIYKKHDRVRKLHNLLIAPNFATVHKINAKLQTIGNLKADGRPILGLDAKELLKIALDASPDCLYIPAHAWTPWFAVFGSKSGFDSLEEAFDELTPYVYAIETGLSSDPAMNWRLSNLDNIALISNSDAHSPGKLGREANVFDTELSYPAIVQAIKTNNPQTFPYTIEFFPEEGKYHLDGHRACNVVLEPKKSKKLHNICPRCSKPLTIGVLQRVDDLANHALSRKPKNARSFKSIIPLSEIIAEEHGKRPVSKAVQETYFKLLHNLGNEFYILLEAPLQAIADYSSQRLAEGIERMRVGNVVVEGGYDGEYGTVSVFKNTPAIHSSGQTALL